jgi:hypothetical protein
MKIDVTGIDLVFLEKQKTVLKKLVEGGIYHHGTGKLNTHAHECLSGLVGMIEEMQQQLGEDQ